MEFIIEMFFYLQIWTPIILLFSSIILFIISLIKKAKKIIIKK